MTETSIPTAGHLRPYDSFESSDGPLAYRDAGPRDGLPLVLLHSGFADHTQFDNLVPALAERYRVITPDARGHGYSANASEPFRQTDDLAALLRHLDLGRPVVLVGISMGAVIAVDTVLEHPELVRALVVSGRGIGEPDLGDPWSAARQEAQRAALSVGDVPGWLDGFAQWIPGPRRSLADVAPGVADKVKEMALRTLMKHAPGETDHLVPVDGVAARAAGITVPVLAINGAFDAPGTVQTADALLRAVPDGRTVLLDGAGHFTTMEQPEAFVRALEAFLAQMPTGSH